MRTSLAFLSGACLLSFSSVAFAQGECPPGSWFCDEEEESSEAGTDQGEAADAEAPKDHSAPPIVVYEPAERRHKAPDKIIVVDRAEHVPAPARLRNHREWGFNLRLEGVLMGDKQDVQPPRHPDAGMGGFGFSFRYRPIPHFAFDAGLDFLAGRDWLGDSRRETALLLSAMIFFNPRDRAQIYTLGGLGFSGAHVLREHDISEPTDESYSYFGGHLGLGLEFRIARKTALNLDLVGFLRGRTDDKARSDPEFVDPVTGRATNTSGGGLVRGGITFYW